MKTGSRAAWNAEACMQSSSSLFEAIIFPPTGLSEEKNSLQAEPSDKQLGKSDLPGHIAPLANSMPHVFPPTAGLPEKKKTEEEPSDKQLGKSDLPGHI